jgi:hypothetical protein
MIIKQYFDFNFKLEVKMFVQKMAIIGSVVALSITSIGAAHAYPKNLFALNSMDFDVNRSPRGIPDLLQTREAKDIVGALAIYMGVDPYYVALATNLAPTYRSAGVETFYDLPTPEGYAFCAARISVTSLAPGSGDGASLIKANATDNPAAGVSIYTVTKVQGIGGGNSWVEGKAQVLGIKPEFLSLFREKGICKAPADTILNCKGNPCPGVEWGSLAGIGPPTKTDPNGDLTKGF